MLEVFSAKGASRHQINALAEWVRDNVARVAEGQIDVIRLVEIDLPALFPGLYLEIADDREMGHVKAYISHDPLGMVVSETTYRRACEGFLDAAETILHEIGHLFLHREYSIKGLNDAHGHYTPQFKKMNAANSVEWQAKYFAFCMLFPYSDMKSYRSRIELQVYLDLSVSQADRVLEHVRKLRLSESERCLKREMKWLASILGQLSLSAERQRPIESGTQFDFFYRLDADKAGPVGRKHGSAASST